MRLLEGVHLVASDAGIGTDPEALLANAERDGVARGRIRLLLLAHAHPDHAGGAAALRRLLPGLRVLASPHVARVMPRLRRSHRGRTVCFDGDLVFYGGLISLEHTWDCDVETAHRQFERGFVPRSVV